MIRVCFVCLGNICRSPAAAGVMRHLVKEAGLADRIQVDSAGTSGYHLGEAPDRRAILAAQRRGVRLWGAARQFAAADFERFEYVLAMDRTNLDHLRRLAPSPEARGRVYLLRTFDPRSPPDAEVPDPFYGGDDGFEEVLDVCAAACRGLLGDIRARL